METQGRVDPRHLLVLVSVTYTLTHGDPRVDPWHLLVLVSVTYTLTHGDPR